MSRPHNNPWKYPPTPRELEREVRRFRRRRTKRGGNEGLTFEQFHDLLTKVRRFVTGGRPMVKVSVSRLKPISKCIYELDVQVRKPLTPETKMKMKVEYVNKFEVLEVGKRSE